MSVKTVADYRALARDRGFTWLGPLPPNVLTVTEWRCARGHRWLARFNHIRQGTGCPVCAKKARRREDDYRQLARDRGFDWLGPFPETTSHHTHWRCAKGHMWSAPYGGLAAGSGCPHCAGKAPRTAGQYTDLAQRRGFVWLGPLRDAHTATRWRCARGHTWRARYQTIASGHGCPYCAGKARRRVADYRALARRRGLVFLGPWPGTVMKPTRWQCRCGKIIVATYAHVARRAYHSGCPLAPKARRGARAGAPNPRRASDEARD